MTSQNASTWSSCGWERNHASMCGLSCPVIRQMLSSYNGAIISVSHDRKYISEVADTVLELGPDGLSDVTDRYG